MEPDPFEPGTIYDRYEVQRSLGSGGMAQVFLVRHTELGTLHALKVLRAGIESAHQRLLREGRLQARLTHRNIVAVTDVIRLPGARGLVMEFIDGPTLEGLLKSYQPTISQVDHLVRQILAGVIVAHEQGLVHRDLKPANILLAGDGGDLVAKVADFGLAKTVGDSFTSTRSGTPMGTPIYMSPEQFRSAKHADHRADVFALGAVMYEILTGQHAFQGDDIIEIYEATAGRGYQPIKELSPLVPKRMEEAIFRALDPDVNERIQDATALRELWEGGTAEPLGVWEAAHLAILRECAPKESIDPPVPEISIAPPALRDSAPSMPSVPGLAPTLPDPPSKLPVPPKLAKPAPKLAPVQRTDTLLRPSQVVTAPILPGVVRRANTSPPAKRPVLSRVFILAAVVPGVLGLVAGGAFLFVAAPWNTPVQEPVSPRPTLPHVAEEKVEDGPVSILSSWVEVPESESTFGDSSSHVSPALLEREYAYAGRTINNEDPGYPWIAASPEHPVSTGAFALSAEVISWGQWEQFGGVSQGAVDDPVVVSLETAQMVLSAYSSARTDGVVFRLPTEAEWEVAVREEGADPGDVLQHVDSPEPLPTIPGRGKPSQILRGQSETARVLRFGTQSAAVRIVRQP